MRARHAEVASAIRIGVDVGYGLLDQFGLVGLDPFGAAEESLLLAVPGGVDDRPPGPPTLFEQGGKAAQFLHLGDQSRQRIRGAVDPTVAMVAPDNPLIGTFGTGNPDDHVMERDPVPVERQFDPYLGRSGAAGLVGDRERAAP